MSQSYKLCEKIRKKTALTCSAMEGEGVRQVTAHKKMLARHTSDTRFAIITS